MKSYQDVYGDPRPSSIDAVRSGDPWEFSNGEPILCLPTGKPGAKGTWLGAEVIGSDPAVEDIGIDAGFKPDPLTLRAPDVSIIPAGDETGFIEGVPPLAIEYADRGQDEEDLKVKIHEFLTRGTRHVWVVRINGPRRVEVHEPGKLVRTLTAGEYLEAPGLLKNSVPVEALYDRKTAHEVTFRNLLQRKGYESLEDVHEEGKAEGKAEGLREGLELTSRLLLAVLVGRGLAVSEAQYQHILSCRDKELLSRWAAQAITCTDVAELLDR